MGRKCSKNAVRLDKPKGVWLLVIFILGVLIISSGLSELTDEEEKTNSADVKQTQFNGWTMVLLSSILLLVLGMCGTLIYGLFIEDIVKWKHLMDDYSEKRGRD